MMGAKMGRLHLGTKDILKEILGQIRHRVKESLKVIRNILPNTRLIWSDILLRAKYQGKVKGGAGKRCTWDLNMYAKKITHTLQNTPISLILPRKVRTGKT